DIADVLRRRGAMIVAAVETDVAAVGDFLEQGPQQRGFAAAVETDHGTDLVAFQVGTEVAEDAGAAQRDRQIADAYQRMAHYFNHRFKGGVDTGIRRESRKHERTKTRKQGG